jgi:eukaryotic-like serine/threonine-protein kinase
VEFQKIIDHPGIVKTEEAVVGSLAGLGLARAYALESDSVKSRAAYQDFLRLWKDADPDIPILKQAKAEYAKLQ